LSSRYDPVYWRAFGLSWKIRLGTARVGFPVAIPSLGSCAVSECCSSKEPFRHYRCVSYDLWFLQPPVSSALSQPSGAFRLSFSLRRITSTMSFSRSLRSCRLMAALMTALQLSAFLSIFSDDPLTILHTSTICNIGGIQGYRIMTLEE